MALVPEIEGECYNVLQLGRGDGAEDGGEDGTGKGGTSAEVASSELGRDLVFTSFD